MKRIFKFLLIMFNIFICDNLIGAVHPEPKPATKQAWNSEPSQNENFSSIPDEESSLGKKMGFGHRSFSEVSQSEGSKIESPLRLTPIRTLRPSSRSSYLQTPDVYKPLISPSNTLLGYKLQSKTNIVNKNIFILELKPRLFMDSDQFNYLFIYYAPAQDQYSVDKYFGIKRYNNFVSVMTDESQVKNIFREFHNYQPDLKLFEEDQYAINMVNQINEKLKNSQRDLIDYTNYLDKIYQSQAGSKEGMSPEDYADIKKEYRQKYEEENKNIILDIMKLVDYTERNLFKKIPESKMHWALDLYKSGLETILPQMTEDLRSKIEEEEQDKDRESQIKKLKSELLKENNEQKKAKQNGHCVIL